MATELSGQGFVTVTPEQFQFEPPSVSDKFPTVRNVIDFSKDSYVSTSAQPMIVDIPYQAGAQLITDRSYIMFRLDINTGAANRYVGIDEYSGGMPFRTVGIQRGETSSTVTESQKYADYTLAMIRKLGPKDALTGNNRTLQATELYEPDAQQAADLATDMATAVYAVVNDKLTEIKNKADPGTTAGILALFTDLKPVNLTKEYFMKAKCSEAIIGGDGITADPSNNGRWIILPLRLLHPFFTSELIPLQYFGQAKSALRLTMQLEDARNVLNFWDGGNTGFPAIAINNATYTITSPKLCIEFAETDPSFNEKFTSMVENKGLPLPFSQYDVQEVADLTDAQEQSIIIEQGHASVNNIIFGFIPKTVQLDNSQPNSLSDFCGDHGLTSFYLKIGNHRLPQSDIHVGAESVMELLKIFDETNDVFVNPRFMQEYSQVMTRNEWALPADVDATKFNRNSKLFGINLDTLTNQLADFSGDEMLSKQARLYLNFAAGSHPSNYDLFIWINHDRVVKVEKDGLTSVE